VFQAVHDGDADPKVLAYQYLQTLPQLAQAQGNTFWVIPSEVTTALKTLSGAFGGPEADRGGGTGPLVAGAAPPAVSAGPSSADPEPAAEAESPGGKPLPTTANVPPTPNGTVDNH